MRSIVCAVILVVGGAGFVSAADKPSAELSKARADNHRLVAQIRKLEREIRELKLKLDEAARDVAIAERAREASLTVQAATATNGAIEGGRNFAYGNLSWGGAASTKIVGEIKNGTTTDYTLALFQVAVYDADGRLVRVVSFSLNYLAAGQTKAFEVEAFDLPHRRDYRFKFSFDGGVEDSGSKD